MFEFDPRRQPDIDDRRPRLVWAAPGSLFVDDVQRAWGLRGDIDDLARVSGPWAVALWSPSNGYVLATDPIGVHPVFWARTSTSTIAAASWLTRLVDRDDVSDALDYEGILLNISVHLSIDALAHRTRFSSVSRVPWGRAVIFDSNGHERTHRYWDPRTLPRPDESMSLADCVETLRSRVDASVRRLLPATGEHVGAHISGGLDCTALACRAHDLLRETGSGLTSAYSWTPDEREVPRFDGDERSLLDDVSQQLGLAITPVFADDTGDWLTMLDPNRFPFSTHNRERYVLPRARRDGVTVILSGWGGDEFASFNGRGVIGSLVRRGRWRTLWHVNRDRYRVTSGIEPTGRAALKSFAGRFLRATPAPVIDLRHPLQAIRQRSHHRSAEHRVREWSPLLADAYRDHGRALQRAHDHHGYQMALLFNGHLQHRTTAWYQTGRIFGIDYRYPLLDKDVVEAALAMPGHAFMSRGWDRVAFRLAIEPWVPPSVAWNPRKDEPALFWPPTRNVIRDPDSEPDMLIPDDPEYRRVLALAQSLRRPRDGQMPNARRVHSRPALAPRP